MRPWSSGVAEDPDDGEDEDEGDEDLEGEAEDRGGLFHRGPKRPVFFGARDSLYFEPLVALAIVVLLFVGLWAYTQNFPPMYVVESSSMQHGDVDQLGLINTGDLVLAQKVPTSQITTYVVGMQTGYQTYGEYGDVILYHPNGQSGPAPIIHRAILYLYYNATDQTYSFPSLSALPCGNQAGAFYTLSSTASGCGTDHATGTLLLHHIGWRSVNVSVDLATLGAHSGFLTMGDNNFNPARPGLGAEDQPALSSLVDPSWVVGVARGMLPWFGSFKLLLEGQAGEVPPQSWQFMAITIVAVLGGAFLIHYALTADRDGAEGGPMLDDDEDEERPRRRGLRLWRSREAEEDEEDEAEESPPPRHRHAKVRASSLLPRRGRPRPQVRKGRAHPRRRHDDPDDDL